MKSLLVSIVAAVVLVGCGGPPKDIWEAAEQGDIEAVKEYLAIGTNVNAKDEVYGGMPLHWAAYRGRKEVAELLINEGADVNAKNQADATPLDKAIEKNRDETAGLLRKHGGKTGVELEDQGKPQDIDLNGKWIGKGYKCWGNVDENGEYVIKDEEIFISQNGNKVIATKITGDECIKAGEKTWEGEISGNWIEGVIYGRQELSVNPKAYKTRIRIKNINMLYLDDAELQFVRMPEGQESKEPSYDLNGKWLGQGYDCFDDNGNPVILDEWVAITQTNNIVTAIKLTGDNCVGEGEVTWKGKIVGNEIRGEFYGKNPYEKKASEYPVILLIKNQNLIFDKRDPSWKFERNIDN